MKRIILESVMAVLVTLFSLNANAYDVKIDNIYYNLDVQSKEATVTYRDPTNSYFGSVTIPSSFSDGENTYSVTSIGEKAFFYCTQLTSVTIPNSVKSIANQAFYWCGSLTSMTIPNSVTSIGNGAFMGCSGLTSVTIPNSVISISGGVFNGCCNLTSVTIPNSVTSIEDYAFAGCI